MLIVLITLPVRLTIEFTGFERFVVEDKEIPGIIKVLVLIGSLNVILRVLVFRSSVKLVANGGMSSLVKLRTSSARDEVIGSSELGLNARSRQVELVTDR